jgi:RNA polymerase sigma-70 factor, ECF subfamily
MDSFRTEVVALLPRLRAFACSLTRGSDLADDLVQDTVLRAFRAREQFILGTNLQAWLFTILRHRHLSLVTRT